ncbi:MAG: PIN domain-containing protein [Planctomycetes bacterium]|nr:PIN domain-containing protein [Planctomycetota bacterium]
MVATFTAIYDASVLYPAPLRDLLLHLALTDLFQARWTQVIHEEWIEALLADRPDLSRERLERTRQLMDASVLDCLVEGYEDLVPGLQLPDPDDRHVLAAAIRVGADVIVTANLKHFPPSSLAAYGIDAQHPDQFVRHLVDLAPGPVCVAVKTHRQSLKTPPKTIAEYLETPQRHSLPETVAALRAFEDLL